MKKNYLQVAFKILKVVLAIFISIVLIICISALFLKKEYAVERQIEIEKPNDSVFNYIKYLKNQDEYSKWALMDTAMLKTFTGTDATVGFISAWDSKVDDVGKGAQEIKKIINGQRIDYELRFEKPMKDVANAYIATNPLGNEKTMVKWGITGKMTYPFNIMGLFMNKIIGSDLEIGLANLKKMMEKK